MRPGVLGNITLSPHARVPNSLRAEGWGLSRLHFIDGNVEREEGDFLRVIKLAAN